MFLYLISPVLPQIHDAFPFSGTMYMAYPGMQLRLRSFGRR
jgi:hypothetical protein